MPANFLAPWQPCPAIRRPIGRARCAVGKSPSMRSTAGIETATDGAGTAACTFTATGTCTLTKQPSSLWWSWRETPQRHTPGSSCHPAWMATSPLLHEPCHRSVRWPAVFASRDCGECDDMAAAAPSPSPVFPEVRPEQAKYAVGDARSRPAACIWKRLRSPHSTTDDTLDDHDGHHAPTR